MVVIPYSFSFASRKSRCITDITRLRNIVNKVSAMAGNNYFAVGQSVIPVARTIKFSVDSQIISAHAYPSVMAFTVGVDFP